MKCKCNICGNPIPIKLPKEVELEHLICCPICDKQITYGMEDYKGVKYWSVIDSEYNKDFGFIPVEIIEK